MKNLEIGTNYEIDEFVDILNYHYDENGYAGLCVVDYETVGFILIGDCLTLRIKDESCDCGLMVAKEVLAELLK